jgi:aminomethyltransferase
MPIQYAGIVPEHLHTRAHASIFDTCHMGEFEFQGPGAESDLEGLVTQSVSSMKDGQCRYGFMLNEQGGVLDDITVFRRNSDHFFMVVNAGTLAADAEWVRRHLSSETRFSDLSSGRAKLDIQGPRSRELMEAVTGSPLPELGYFRFCDSNLCGIPCTLSRTGYTGEWGYEFYFDADSAGHLWHEFLGNSGIRPAGLGARDTLRLEVGYPLYGHELNSEQTPVAAFGGQFVDTSKSFIGHEAVVRELDEGPPRKMCGLRLQSKRAAREGARVTLDGAEVGSVTSGSLAPSLRIAVAIAFVDSNLTEPGTPLKIQIRGKSLPAEVVELPFYRDGTARKK